MLVIHSASRCDVCLLEYTWETSAKSPHAIACGHVFCRDCLYAMHPPICPFCRKAYQPAKIKKLHLDRPENIDEAREGEILRQQMTLLERLVTVWESVGGGADSDEEALVGAASASASQENEEQPIELGLALSLTSNAPPPFGLGGNQEVEDEPEESEEESEEDQQLVSSDRRMVRLASSAQVLLPPPQVPGTVQSPTLSDISTQRAEIESLLDRLGGQSGVGRGFLNRWVPAPTPPISGTTGGRIMTMREVRQAEAEEVLQEIDAWLLRRDPDECQPLRKARRFFTQHLTLRTRNLSALEAVLNYRQQHQSLIDSQDELLSRFREINERLRLSEDNLAEARERLRDAHGEKEETKKKIKAERDARWRIEWDKLAAENTALKSQLASLHSHSQSNPQPQTITSPRPSRSSQNAYSTNTNITYGTNNPLPPPPQPIPTGHLPSFEQAFSETGGSIYSHSPYGGGGQTQSPYRDSFGSFSGFGNATSSHGTRFADLPVDDYTPNSSRSSRKHQKSRDRERVDEDGYLVGSFGHAGSSSGAAANGGGIGGYTPTSANPAGGAPLSGSGHGRFSNRTANVPLPDPSSSGLGLGLGIGSLTPTHLLDFRQSDPSSADPFPSSSSASASAHHPTANSGPPTASSSNAASRSSLQTHFPATHQPLDAYSLTSAYLREYSAGYLNGQEAAKAMSVGGSMAGSHAGSVGVGGGGAGSGVGAAPYSAPATSSGYRGQGHRREDTVEETDSEEEDEEEDDEDEDEDGGLLSSHPRRDRDGYNGSSSASGTGLGLGLGFTTSSSASIQHPDLARMLSGPVSSAGSTLASSHSLSHLGQHPTHRASSNLRGSDGAGGVRRQPIPLPPGSTSSHGHPSPGISHQHSHSNSSNSLSHSQSQYQNQSQSQSQAYVPGSLVTSMNARTNALGLDVHAALARSVAPGGSGGGRSTARPTSPLSSEATESSEGDGSSGYAPPLLPTDPREAQAILSNQLPPDWYQGAASGRSGVGPSHSSLGLSFGGGSTGGGGGSHGGGGASSGRHSPSARSHAAHSQITEDSWGSGMSGTGGAKTNSLISGLVGISGMAGWHNDGASARTRDARLSIASASSLGIGSNPGHGGPGASGSAPASANRSRRGSDLTGPSATSGASASAGNPHRSPSPVRPVQTMVGVLPDDFRLAGEDEERRDSDRRRRRREERADLTVTESSYLQSNSATALDSDRYRSATSMDTRFPSSSSTIVPTNVHGHNFSQSAGAGPASGWGQTSSRPPQTSHSSSGSGNFSAGAGYFSEYERTSPTRHRERDRGGYRRNPDRPRESESRPAAHRSVTSMGMNSSFGFDHSSSTPNNGYPIQAPASATGTNSWMWDNDSNVYPSPMATSYSASQAQSRMHNTTQNYDNTTPAPGPTQSSHRSSRHREHESSSRSQPRPSVLSGRDSSPFPVSVESTDDERNGGGQSRSRMSGSASNSNTHAGRSTRSGYHTSSTSLSNLNSTSTSSLTARNASSSTLPTTASLISPAHSQSAIQMSNGLGLQGVSSTAPTSPNPPVSAGSATISAPMPVRGEHQQFLRSWSGGGPQ